MKKMGWIFLALVLAAGCRAKNVAQVGDTTITEKDIAARQKVSDIYYPDSGKPYVALAQLIQGFLAEQALKSLEYPVNEQIWEAESNRIDQNTKAPETLAKIKDVFGLDHKSYLKVFIRPLYAERYLYNEVFLNSTEIHKERYEQAQNFLKAALKEPGAFPAVADKMGLKAAKVKLSEKEGISPYEEKKKPEPEQAAPEPANIDQANWYIKKISILKPGQVYPELIEWREGFQVIKFDRKEGGVFIIASVTVPKEDYGRWFYQRASKVPVKIYDQALKDELLKNVNWAGQLNLK